MKHRRVTRASRRLDRDPVNDHPNRTVPSGHAQVTNAWSQATRAVVTGAFDLSRLAYAAFRATGRGNIINISSVAGVATLPQRAFYGASKAALNHLTQLLAAEGGRDGDPRQRRSPLVYTHTDGSQCLVARRVVPPDSRSDTVCSASRSPRTLHARWLSSACRHQATLQAICSPWTAAFWRRDFDQ